MANTIFLEDITVFIKLLSNIEDLKKGAAKVIAPLPEILIIPMAPAPGGVAKATIGSKLDMAQKYEIDLLRHATEEGVFLWNTGVCSSHLG